MKYGIILLLLVNVNCECLNGWSRYKDSCYWASTRQASSFRSAQRDCESKDGYLAEIQDLEENDFIAKMTFGGGTWFLTGITHIEKCGGWVTATNQKKIDYSNWNDEEKNKVERPPCVTIGYRGFWDTISCDQKQYFVCESDSYISSSAFGYVYHTNTFQYNGHHYRTIGRKETYRMAQDLCKKAGAYLVEPNTEGENEYVHDKMLEAFKGYWRYIGGSDRADEGYWVWRDNKPLTFENWWPGEPNDARYGEECFEMRYLGKWNDVSCYDYKKYICEMPAKDATTTEEIPTTTERRPTTSEDREETTQRTFTLRTNDVE